MIWGVWPSLDVVVLREVISAMSQSIFSQAMENPQSTSYDPSANTEFNYRPVPVLAPVSFFLGLLSALGFLGILVVPIGLVGTVVSLVCIMRLRRFRGEYGGMWLAVSGLLMSFVCFTTSAGLWAYGYRTEVPEGFHRINFQSDLSNKGFVIAKKSSDIFHPDVKALDGQKVFIKGYMYPTKQMQGITSFLLVKDNAQCCFGGNPAMQDMILVNLDPGKTVDFRQGILMSVGGVFHCQPTRGPAGLTPVYTIDGNFAESARTIF
jgi:hypothetical protein